jgi:hypothetical protein
MEGKFTLVTNRNDIAGWPAPAGSLRMAVVSGAVWPSEPGAVPFHSGMALARGGAVFVVAHAGKMASNQNQAPIFNAFR